MRRMGWEARGMTLIHTLQARCVAILGCALVVACGGNDTPAPANQAPVASIASPAAGATDRKSVV